MSRDDGGRERMKLSTKKMTTTAMLAAVTAVLGLIALDFGTFKITLESLPVILAGLMFGPVCGVLTGGIGTFLYQLYKYGLEPSTPLWVLPYMAAGLVSGLLAKKAGYSNTNRQIFLISTLCLVLITVLNSFGMYVVGYYAVGNIGSSAFWVSLGIRSGTCLIKIVAFGALLPILLKKLAPFTGNPKAERK